MTPYTAIVPRSSHHGGHDYAVYLYDADKPRQLEADNPAARYELVRAVGVYPTKTGAEMAARRALRITP